jgi:hypothetical protein
MSFYERNKGILYATGQTTHGMSDEEEDVLFDNDNYLVIGKDIYQVVYEVQGEECFDFAELEWDDNIAGYRFHTIHYNGECGLTEVLQDAMKHNE